MKYPHFINKQLVAICCLLFCVTEITSAQYRNRNKNGLEVELNSGLGLTSWIVDLGKDAEGINIYSATATTSIPVVVGVNYVINRLSAGLLFGREINNISDVNSGISGKSVFNKYGFRIGYTVINTSAFELQPTIGFGTFRYKVVKGIEINRVYEQIGVRFSYKPNERLRFFVAPYQEYKRISLTKFDVNNHLNQLSIMVGAAYQFVRF